MADGLLTLVLGRLVQALGAGCGTTLVRTIARDAYGAERLVKAIAYLTMFYTLGPMVSPIVGGILIDTLGWRSVFGFAVLAGALSRPESIWRSRRRDRRRLSAGSGVGMAPLLRALFAHLRFAAFVLQTGFSTATFIVVATAAPTLMKEAINRSGNGVRSLFPTVSGRFLSRKLVDGPRSEIAAQPETMVLLGSLLSIVGRRRSVELAAARVR